MKIGFLSLPLSGHINPMTTLARKLQSRGHDVVFIAVPDSESVVRATTLILFFFDKKEYPAGSIGPAWSAVAKMHGDEVLRYSSRKLTSGLSKAALEHLPQKIA